MTADFQKGKTMKKSSFGAIVLIAMVMSGCATSKSLVDLDKEGMLAKPGNKMFVAYYPSNCPDEKTGIMCEIDQGVNEDGLIAYAAKSKSSVLVAEQAKESGSAAKNAAWTIMRIGAAAVGGAAGQGFSIGTAGGSFSSDRYTEFSIVADGNLSKVDCGDYSESECRTNLQKLMMGQKIALKSKGPSVADQDMAEYMKRHNK